MQSMGPGLKDLAAHNRWATLSVLKACRGLNNDLLNATVPGTLGTVIETLRHIVGAESGYVRRLTQAWESPPWPDMSVGVDVLIERQNILSDTLDTFLAEDWDEDRPGEARSDDGTVF